MSKLIDLKILNTESLQWVRPMEGGGFTGIQAGEFIGIFKRQSVCRIKKFLEPVPFLGSSTRNFNMKYAYILDFVPYIEIDLEDDVGRPYVNRIKFPIETFRFTSLELAKKQAEEIVNKHIHVKVSR